MKFKISILYFLSAAVKLTPTLLPDVALASHPICWSLFRRGWSEHPRYRFDRRRNIPRTLPARANYFTNKRRQNAPKYYIFAKNNVRWGEIPKKVISLKSSVNREFSRKYFTSVKFAPPKCETSYEIAPRQRRARYWMVTLDTF